MAKQWQYRVTVGGEQVAQGDDLTGDMVALARTVLVAREEGATSKIERRSGPREGWQPHRTYVIGADGIVRRTDR